jgi:hypothetical protein
LFKRGTKIANYIGDKVSKEAYLLRQEAGFGGYVVRIHKTQDVYLDCHNHAMAGRCFASKANSPHNCFMIVNNTKVTNLRSNAELIIHTDQVNHVITAYLKATKNIYPGQEVLVPYSASYRFEDVSA